MRLSLPALLLSAAGLLGSTFHATAQAPTKIWDKTLGGFLQDEPVGVRQTPDGGYVVAGTSQSGIGGDKTQASQGSSDFWIVRLNAAGTKLWDRRFGGHSQESMYTFLPTSDGGHLLGGLTASGISGDISQQIRGSADYWVVKVDSAGTKLWERRFGGSDVDLLYDIKQTSDGGYLLGGLSASDISGDKTQASQGMRDYWVVKIDANGTKQWDRTYGSTQNDNLRRLLLTSDGGYLLCGDSSSPIGGDKTQGSIDADFWVVKISANGTKQWDSTISGLGENILAGLAPTNDGGYILGGKVSSVRLDLHYWMVKIDAVGTKLWDRHFGGGGGRNDLKALLPTADGGYLLGGDSSDGVSGDKTQPNIGVSSTFDFWVVKTDAAGNKQWDKTVGSTGNDFLTGLEQSRDGSFLLTGITGSTTDGDKTEPGQGFTDYWVVKLGSAPLATTPLASRPTLSAYPNPARTQLTLRGPVGTPYQLLNQLGQVVRSGKVSAQPLDVQDLPAGLYLLRDETTGRATKLVKE